MKTMFELSSLLYFKAGDNLCCLWPSVSADESWLTIWLVLILPWSLYSFHVCCSVYSRFLHRKVFEAFFCFGHSIWFGLNWQWYCAIIELSWRWYHDLSKLKSESSAEATSHAIVHCLNALMIDQSDFL